MFVAITRLSGERAADVCHPFVKPGQCDDGLDAVVAQRPFELMLRVGRIEWRDDGAKLPGGEFGYEELRTVRQQQPDAIAARDAEARPALRRRRRFPVRAEPRKASSP